MMVVPAPQSEDELLERADRIAGRTLGQLAARHGRAVPDDFRHAKGWVGQLIETCLGASAGNRPAPDFVDLGVELKTLPINADRRPAQTTYVCRVPLAQLDELTWRTSRVFKKLRRVLWVPIAAVPEVRIADRPVGQALLWGADGDLGEALRQDWVDHTDTLRRGYVEQVTAADGRYLQIRPKAADSTQRIWAPGRHGGPVLTVPRGYYLRRDFTAQIVANRYA